MKICEIEKNVVCPTKGMLKYADVLQQVIHMEIDDSFLVVYNEDEKISPMGMSSAIGKRYRGTKRKFICKKIAPDKIRVWRVK